MYGVACAGCSQGAVCLLHPACLTARGCDGAHQSDLCCHITHYRGKAFALPVSEGTILKSDWVLGFFFFCLFPEVSSHREEKRCSSESKLTQSWQHSSHRGKSCHGEAIAVMRRHGSSLSGVGGSSLLSTRFY